MLNLRGNYDIFNYFVYFVKQQKFMHRISIQGAKTIHNYKAVIFNMLSDYFKAIRFKPVVT